MDPEAWRAVVHGVAKRVGHDLATKQQQYNYTKVIIQVSKCAAE